MNLSHATAWMESSPLLTRGTAYESLLVRISFKCTLKKQVSIILPDCILYSFPVHVGTFLCNLTLDNMEIDFHVCGLMSHNILQQKIAFNLILYSV